MAKTEIDASAVRILQLLVESHEYHDHDYISECKCPLARSYRLLEKRREFKSAAEWMCVAKVEKAGK